MFMCRRSTANHAIETSIPERQVFARTLASEFGVKIGGFRPLPSGLSSIFSPVTLSEAVTPHEASSRPDPQPKSRTLMNGNSSQPGFSFWIVRNGILSCFSRFSSARGKSREGEAGFRVAISLVLLIPVVKSARRSKVSKKVRTLIRTHATSCIWCRRKQDHPK